ncbi:MerR family transcriptional regulator [Arachidicoccus terrestris]|nr:MerR family transcriptional regulator [Arachidicoccus terrestris]
MPPKPLEADIKPDDEASLETEARKSPELDTSFSPDEFASQELDQQEATGPQENIAEANLLTDNEIIHSDTRSTPSEGEIINNQDNRSENAAKKPFYIEDQTVPVRKRGRKSFKEIDAEVDLINIPSDEELFQKQYYPISVVAKWFRVNNSLLRFWENEFKILKPKKNKKGDRFFRPEDVKNLQLIYYLLRQKKLTINGAIKHLKSYKEQTEVNMQLIQTLNDFKGFLLELRAATEK